MKKTLILTDRFYPEEFLINEFFPEFTARGMAIDILTQIPSYPFGKVSKYPGYRNRFFSKKELKGIAVYRVGTIEGYRNNKFLKFLHYLNFAFLCSSVLLFIGKRYDRIFVVQTGPLTQALPAVLAKKLFHCRMIIWTLDIWPDTVYALGHSKTWWLRKVMDWMVGTIYRNSDEIFVSSRGFIPRINEYAPGKAIHFMPQWSVVKNDEKASEVILDRAFFHFTFAGNIGQSQNLETVIEGFGLARKKASNIRLNIFGDGNNLDKLKQLAAERDIPDVVFWGRKPQAEMSSIFSQSDVLLISLKPDPLFELYLPFKLTSYLQARKPILAVLNGEVSNLVKEFNIGLTADPSSPESISGAILQFTSMDQDQMEEYPLRMETLQKEMFDPEKILKQFFNIFEKLK